MLSGERVRIAKRLIPSIAHLFGVKDEETLAQLETVVVAALSVEAEEVRAAHKLDVVMNELAAVKAGVAHILISLRNGERPQPNSELMKRLGIVIQERSPILLP